VWSSYSLNLFYLCFVFFNTLFPCSTTCFYYLCSTCLFPFLHASTLFHMSLSVFCKSLLPRFYMSLPVFYMSLLHVFYMSVLPVLYNISLLTVFFTSLPLFYKSLLSVFNNTVLYFDMSLPVSSCLVLSTCIFPCITFLCSICFYSTYLFPCSTCIYPQRFTCLCLCSTPILYKCSTSLHACMVMCLSPSVIYVSLAVFCRTGLRSFLPISAYAHHVYTLVLSIFSTFYQKYNDYFSTCPTRVLFVIFFSRVETPITPFIDNSKLHTICIMITVYMIT